MPKVTQVYDEHGTAGLRAEFRVECNAGDLLELLWQPEAVLRLSPEILRYRILAAQPDRMDVAFEVDATLQTVEFVLRRTFDRKRSTIRWRELSGDVRRIRGSWRVRDGGSNLSEVTYEAYVDVGYFVPTRLVRRLALRKLHAFIERVVQLAAEI